MMFVSFAYRTIYDATPKFNNIIIEKVDVQSMDDIISLEKEIENKIGCLKVNIINWKVL